MKWGTCHMINVASGTKPCKLFTSERGSIVRHYSLLDRMSGKHVEYSRCLVVAPDEAVWVIATLTHSENAFTKYIWHSTKRGASIVYMQPRSRGLEVFPRVQKCFGGKTDNNIEPFFQDQHQCLATKPRYGPVPLLKWFLGGCHVILSWPVHASMVRLVTLQPHRMHPSSTLSSSFLLKNGSNSAVHVLSHPMKIQCLTTAITGSLRVPSFIFAGH